MTKTEVVLQGLQYNLNAPLEVRDAGRRKGKGVFAQEDIPTGTFLCEYRTKRVYHPRKKEKYEKEYTYNKEGSYLLETVQGERLVFDATRVYNQLGRYINHGTKDSNCTYHPPLMVRGKKRVGFLSTKFIKKGDELLYDYGIRGEAWMAPAAVESPKKNKILAGVLPQVQVLSSTWVFSDKTEEKIG